jgi:hypothetical protein
VIDILGMVVTSVKKELAGYKAPRHVVVLDYVRRQQNGKADHGAARGTVLNAPGTIKMEK